MTAPKWLINAVEEIDAALFTGDTLHDQEVLKDFEWYLARWSKQVVEIKDECKYPIDGNEEKGGDDV